MFITFCFQTFFLQRRSSYATGLLSSVSPHKFVSSRAFVRCTYLTFGLLHVSHEDAFKKQLSFVRFVLAEKNSGCSFFLSDKRSSSHCFGHYREMHLFYDIQSVHWETELLKMCLLFFHTETSKRTNQRCEGIPISCHKVPHFHLAIHSASPPPTQFRLSRAQHVLPAA